MRVQIVTLVLRDGSKVSAVFPAFWENADAGPDAVLPAKAVEVGAPYEDPTVSPLECELTARLAAKDDEP